MKPLTINNLSSRFKGYSSLPLDLSERLKLLHFSIYLFSCLCFTVRSNNFLDNFSLLAGTQVSMDDDI